MQAGCTVVRLTCQFRLPIRHSDSFHSRVSGFKVDSIGVSEQSQLTWARLETEFQHVGTSGINTGEYDKIRVDVERDVARGYAVLIACFYSAQARAVGALVDANVQLRNVTVLTVGQSQGSEAEAVYVLTSNPSLSPFMIEPRSAVVAISRHRKKLVISSTEQWLHSTPFGRAYAQLLQQHLEQQVLPVELDTWLRSVQSLRDTALVVSSEDDMRLRRLCIAVERGLKAIHIQTRVTTFRWRGYDVPVVLDLPEVDE
eukprot:3152656-Amphidinium_carterae.1